MDDDLIKSIIGRFDRNAFEAFFKRLLSNSELYSGKIEKLSHIDDRIFECPPERFYQSADAFLMCYAPFTVFENFTLDNLDLTELRDLMSKYISKRKYDPWLPVDGVTLYAINNFDTEKLGIDDEELLSLYKKELTSMLPNNTYGIGAGNINTFIKASAKNQAVVWDNLHNFLTENDDGICISLTDSGIHTSRFIAQNEFSGVTRKSMSLIQPTLKKVIVANDVLVEFNKLIFSDAKESHLEEFLRQHYQEIFGGKYDKISTQLWLKFPDLDIGKKDRRLDIFMRNTLIGDWELFELKRSNIDLSKSISDVPMFVSAVHDAIAQVKNYKRLLEQDKVKRALADEGIEYYEPNINLVIGKKPSIPIYQWRRLLADNQSDIRLTTYDMLYEEAKQRLADAENILHCTHRF